jgi:hypothetical protein
MNKIFSNYYYPDNLETIPPKNLDPKNLGINADKSINQTKHNFKNLPKYLDALLYDNNTQVDNKTKDLPYKSFRDEYPEKDYPINKNSYFVKSGFCPVSANSKSECLNLDPNYIWIDNPVNLPSNISSFYKEEHSKHPNTPNNGYCYKPRYSYINNNSSSKILNGILPSLMDNINDMNPVNYFKIVNGYPIMGSNDDEPARFRLLPCIENFNNYSSTKKIFKSYIMENSLGVETLNDTWIENFTAPTNHGHLIAENTSLNTYKAPYVSENLSNMVLDKNTSVTYSKNADPMTWMKTQLTTANDTETTSASNKEKEVIEKGVDIELPREQLYFGLTLDKFVLVCIFLLAFLFLACQKV